MKTQRPHPKTLLFAVSFCVVAAAVTPDQKNLPRGLAPFESAVQLSRTAEVTDPPTGHIRSLAEWEDAEAVMTLWPNPSLIEALTAHGNVRILTDGAREQSWWANWLASNNLSSEKISYFNVRTDSMWVRDYGPWFIFDGNGKMGIVDTIYNRPRPNDDLVPQFLGKELKLPVYQPGLVHTGGNYYNDGIVDAFSSTLVYSENASLKKTEVNGRMLSYLGIENYTTANLAPKITIQHIDTFGKLVTPDTWVFSEFPVGSRFRQDSENYVALLKKMNSPYGTPYKILRMKMHLREGVTRESRAEDYRAYINSFISNRVLYYPSYNDEIDAEAKSVYQEALPGYEIVGVNNGNTSWGDSVHCRNRNLLRTGSLHLFAWIKNNVLWVEAYPSPDAVMADVPLVTVSGSLRQPRVAEMTRSGDRLFHFDIAGRSQEKLQFEVSAVDSRGMTKIIPQGAPRMKIDYVLP